MQNSYSCGKYYTNFQLYQYIYHEACLKKITANKETEERFAATGIHTPPNISKAGIKDLWPKQQLLTQGNQIIDYKSKCT